MTNNTLENIKFIIFVLEMLGIVAMIILFIEFFPQISNAVYENLTELKGFIFGHISSYFQRI